VGRGVHDPHTAALDRILDARRQGANFLENSLRSAACPCVRLSSWHARCHTFSPSAVRCDVVHAEAAGGKEQPLGVNRARDIRIARGDALRRNPMKAFANVISSFVRNEEGQDLLEYALLVALIALVAVGAVTAAGLKVNTIFNQIATAI